MIKLLICDDETLTKKGTIAANIRLIKKYIEDGNRFLLTTKDTKDDLLKEEYDGISYIHKMNQLNMHNIEYTDLSCLDGLYLYDGENNPVHCYSLNQELVNKISKVPREKNCIVDITKSVPDYNNIHDNSIGDLHVYVSSKNKDKFLRAKKCVKKIVKEYGEDIRYTMSCNHDIYYSAFFYIRPIEASEDNQIKYIMDKYNIINENVLDLRGDNPETLYSHIDEFNKKILKR